jgi:hypothetical protein
MQFNIGYVKSENQFLMKTFSVGQNEVSKILELEELKNSDLQALIYDEVLIENEELKAVLSEDSRFFPIRSNKDLDITLDSFESLNFDSADKIFKRIKDNWVLQNNVTLMEELFPVINHLNKLWPNDRTSFYEELWFIMKSNIGAKELTIVFNDIEMGKKEHEKNKLIQAKITGTNLPQPSAGTEFEAKLMEHYKNDFNHNFDIMEFQIDKGEMVATGTIKKSPFVVMAKVYSLTRLQKALFKMLFDGLSTEFTA